MIFRGREGYLLGAESGEQVEKVGELDSTQT